MTVLTIQEEDRSIANQAHSSSALPGATAPARLTTTVPREYVHRSCLAEVFLSGCEQTGPARYTLTGQWPRAHTFFTTPDGLSHDPLQAAETIRQTGLYLAHAELGVPLGHQFLMWDMHFNTHPERLLIGPAPTDLSLTAVCTEMRWKGKRLSQFTMEITIDRDGLRCASGGGRFTCIAPAIYQRLRGATHTERPARRSHPATTADAASFGRRRPCDIVLSPTGHPHHWLLDPDPQHPILFDHDTDHIPGMVLLEAARQAACAQTGGLMTPVKAAARFHRYAEFHTPCWIHAAPLHTDNHHSHDVLITGTQNEQTVFTARLHNPAPTPTGRPPHHQNAPEPPTCIGVAGRGRVGRS